jgi:hypothetical protein
MLIFTLFFAFPVFFILLFVFTFTFFIAPLFLIFWWTITFCIGRHTFGELLLSEIYWW